MAISQPTYPTTTSLLVTHLGAYTDTRETATKAYADSAIATAVANRVIGSGITNIVSITQAAYDALGTKVATTLYVISG